MRYSLKLLAAILCGCLTAWAVVYLTTPASSAELNPNATLTFDWNNPDTTVMQAFAERMKAAGEHNAKVLSQSMPPQSQRGKTVDVNRDLKGDRLNQETLAVQYQGLRPDGTPVEEYEFHKQEEATSSAFAKK